MGIWSSSTPPEPTTKQPPRPMKMYLEASEVPWDLSYLGEDFDLATSAGTLKGQKFLPPSEPKFAYIFMHGLSVSLTFKNDFYPFILNKQGAVYATDHIGHGRSPGKNCSCMINEVRDEIECLIQMVKKEHPSLPVFLHGHSMGGLSTVSYVLHNKENIISKVKGVVVEAPWISESPQKPLSALELYGLWLISYVVPTCQMSNPTTTLDENEDPNWAKTLDGCKLFHHEITPRLMVSVYDETDFVHKNISEYDKNLPMLFLQGKKDKLVNPTVNEEWIKKLKDTYKESEIKYMSFEDGPHVLMKSKYRKEVIEAVLEFIEKHL